MKKFIYLCGMMLLSLNMMGQIDLNDENWDWDHAFEDEFNTIQSWNPTTWLSIPNSVWKAYPTNWVMLGSNHQIYQYDHCLFDDVNGVIKIVSEYDPGSIQTYQYDLPPLYNYPNTYGQNEGLFYFSGEIDTRTQFRYGYFEIRCKLPIHQGAFPAFWVHASSTDSLDPYYEEIDFFEYSWSNGDPSSWLPFPNPNPTYPGDPHFITTGIYHNLHGHGSYPPTDSYARNYPKLPPGQDVSGWHTYSCEWMPDHVYWYLDGQLVNSYDDVSHIPRHPLRLKTNYAINRYAMENYSHNGNPDWKGSDLMVVDYIHVYQLVWNCETDETISCQSDLDNFPYAVKRAVSVTSSMGIPIVSSSDNVTFRVTESFEITGSFEVQQGGKFTVILQDCPD